MSSTQRAVSQVPRFGTYVATATTIAGFTGLGATNNVTGVTVGQIYYDMGKTVYVTAGGVNYVLRKIQKAVAGGTLAAADTFYINIGSHPISGTGDAVLASAGIARL